MNQAIARLSRPNAPAVASDGSVIASARQEIAGASGFSGEGAGGDAPGQPKSKAPPGFLPAGLAVSSKGTRSPATLWLTYFWLA